MNIVYGAITRITYFNEANNFGIVKIKLDYKDPKLAKFKEKLFSNSLTVLSNFDRKPLIEEEYEFNGELALTSYGWQFKAQSFLRRNEQSEEGIITYLSSDYFPGIGKSAATRIYEALGATCLRDIAKDKSLLEKVKISKKQRQVVYDVLHENYENEQQIIQLLNLGLSMRLALRILKAIPNQAESLVKQNPYQLIDLVEGIGFIRADGIAMQLGIKKNDSLRLKSLLIFILKNYVNNNGNTYILENDWFVEAIRYANLEEEIINKDNFDILRLELIKERKIIQEQKDIYLSKIYYEELKLAAKINHHLSQEAEDINRDQIEYKLLQVMKTYDIEYTDRQKQAIKVALLEPISIITGGPGTGKSTIIKGLIDTYVSLFPKPETIREAVKLVAPTGRAAKRLRELTKHPATTIHKLLEYEGGDFFLVSPDTPIEAKLIIIDEFSMVDISLASLLLNCLLPTTKIVIIGDSDQLPSVGPGNVLRDLIDSKEITVTKLDQIHRQAEDSSIISLAYDIRENRLPYNILELQEDRSFIKCDNMRIIPLIEQTITQAIEKKMDLINDIQVLAPIYKTEVGIDAINSALQKKFNPDGEEINIHSRRFRVNDKVIQLVNRHEKQVMNGDIGYILSISYNDNKFSNLTVMFDFGPVIYEEEEIEDLSLAYAISIHKAQGSEFPLVIIPFSFKYYVMLKRKLIYTATTRAKRYLIMIGSIDAMRKGVVELEDERKTKLALRIKEALNNEGFKQEENIIEELKPEDFM